MTRYLVMNESAIDAQLTVAKRKMGHEVYDDQSGEYISPWDTKQAFEIIHHPTQNLSAIVIPDLAPLGMQGGEDWSRGKPREYDGQQITGPATPDEVADMCWPTNKPLTDHETMITNGWFD